MKTKFLGLVFCVLFLLMQSSARGHMRWLLEKGSAFPEQHYTMDLTMWLVVLGGLLFFLIRGGQIGEGSMRIPEIRRFW